MLLLLSLAVAGNAAWAQPPEGDFYWVETAPFNAVCDGTTDDTTALQAALDAVEAGGTLVFPMGKVCLHTGGLEMVGGHDFVIEGNGSTLRLVATTEEDYPTSLKFDNCDRFEVRNLTVDGNRDNRPVLGGDTNGGNNIAIKGSRQALFQHVRSIGSPGGDGFYLADVTHNSVVYRTRDIQFVACEADSNRRNGMSIADAESVQVLGGVYANSNGGGPEAGVEIEAVGSSQAISNVLVSGVTSRGNHGAGFQITASSGGVTDNVRILGNDVADNARGAFRVRSQHITIRDNHIHDHSADTNNEVATLVVFPECQDIEISGNRFDRIETGLDILWVQAGALRVNVTGNTFDSINTEEEAGSVVRHDGVEGLVAENNFNRCGFRGIYVTGARSTIRDNVLNGMRRNVIWANAQDINIVGNVIGPLAVAGDSTAGQSVIRSRGNGGLVTDNSLQCIDTTQRGLLLDLNPILVAHNIIKSCSSTNWLQFLAGTGSTVLDNNVHY